jgi:glutamate/tyrosine decarboxylase-like PLP-dependent enzyme
MKTKTIPVALPAQGISSDELMNQLRERHHLDVDWKAGKTWSLVYHAGEEHDHLLKDAYEEFFSENYLNPFAFKSLQYMEREVVRMTAGMLHGNEKAVGTMSSGGTESILLAVYTYREWARHHHPHIKNPEIIAPQTIHPAFDKAAHLFGLLLHKTPVDEGRRALPEEMEPLINKNTILLVASAPSYPNGILDPIDRIAILAEKYRLPFHVDACIGGFMLPWMERLGIKIPDWDFRIPGVTSISADVHKFGFGPKGSSVILYRSMEYLKHQFIITTDYPGGIYISPTLMGTRAGGSIAAAWAGMKHLGESGYVSLAQKLLEGTRRLKALLAKIPEIKIIGDPVMNIVSYSTNGDQPDIFVIADSLEKKGWLVDRQQNPDCIHLTIMPTNVKVIDQYVNHLRSAIEFARGHPRATGEGNAALYGLMARIPFRGMVEKNVRKLFEELYGGERSEQNEPAETLHSPGWMGMVSRFLAFRQRHH